MISNVFRTLHGSCETEEYWYESGIHTTTTSRLRYGYFHRFPFLLALIIANVCRVGSKGCIVRREDGLHGEGDVEGEEVRMTGRG